MFRTRAALAAAGTAAFLAAGIPAAHAAEGQAPTVQWASSVADDLGTLQVSISSDSAVTGITAHIVSAATQQEVAVVETEAFVLGHGTTDDGVWHTREPLSLPALGSYTVHVEATDADGDHATRNSMRQPGVLRPGGARRRAQRSHRGRHRQPSGTCRRRPEGTPSGHAAAGATGGPPRGHRRGLLDREHPRTDAEGRFSGTVTMNAAAQIQAVYRYANEHPHVLYGASQEIPIGVRQVATRWVVQSPAEPRTIDFGQEVTLTATLERETPQGWKPFAGQSGGVLFEPSGGGQSAGVGASPRTRTAGSPSPTPPGRAGPSS